MASSRAVANLHNRSLHLRITPRPASLSESREIMRVLAGFGELSAYKSLRYEYHSPAANIALAVFRTPTAAQSALDASPLRFALTHIPQQDPHTSPTDADHDTDEATTPPIPNRSASLISPPSLLTRTHAPPPPTPPPTRATPPLPFSRPAPANPPVEKWFQVTLDRSRVVHQDFIERQPLWKQFSPTRSMGQEDLKDKVPLRGLSDVSKRPPNAHRTPNWVLKGMGEYVERMEGLRGLWEGEQERR